MSPQTGAMVFTPQKALTFCALDVGGSAICKKRKCCIQIVQRLAKQNKIFLKSIFLQMMNHDDLKPQTIFIFTCLYLRFLTISGQMLYAARE